MAYRSVLSAPAILRPQPISAFQCPALAADRLLPLPAAWQCDLSDNSLRWTDGVFELFGIARGARSDRRETAAMYCDESRELLERLRANAIATCGSFTFEAEIQRLDGGRRWMRVTADVVSSNGRATHLYGHKQDITGEVV